MLAKADRAFEAKWAEAMSYEISEAKAKRRNASIYSGFPDLHRERAEVLFQAEGPWANELQRLAVLCQRLIDEPSVAARVECGVLKALIGGRGGGKTQLAACLARLDVAWERRPKYTTAQTLFRQLRSTFKNPHVSEQNLIDSMQKPNLLVIDELHDRAESDYESRILNAIVDGRYGSGKFTLMISNETADQFANSIGPSIASRFEEAGEIITVNWPSFRTR